MCLKKQDKKEKKMNELLKEAVRIYPNSEYQYNEEDNTVIVITKSKFVFVLYYKNDNSIGQMCLHEPIFDDRTNGERP